MLKSDRHVKDQVLVEEIASAIALRLQLTAEDLAAAKESARNYLARPRPANSPRKPE